MASSDLSAIASELAAIKLILYVIGALVIVSVVLTCLRSYAHVKQFVRSHLGEMFREDARLLLEKNHLEQPVQLAKQRIKERPNDADGHWYLARAFQLQGRSQEALNEFEATRKLAPTSTQGRAMMPRAPVSETLGVTTRAVNCQSCGRTVSAHWIAVFAAIPAFLGGLALMKSESLVVGIAAVVAGVLMMGVLHTFLVPLVRSDA